MDFIESVKSAISKYNKYCLDQNSLWLSEQIETDEYRESVRAAYQKLRSEFFDKSFRDFSGSYSRVPLYDGIESRFVKIEDDKDVYVLETRDVIGEELYVYRIASTESGPRLVDRLLVEGESLTQAMIVG